MSKGYLTTWRISCRRQHVEIVYKWKSNHKNGSWQELARHVRLNAI